MTYIDPISAQTTAALVLFAIAGIVVIALIDRHAINKRKGPWG